MKKSLKTVVILAALLAVGTSVLAQRNSRLFGQEHQKEIKKHNFGVGVQTDFVAKETLSNFTPPQSFLDCAGSAKVFGIDVENNTYFNAFLEYQYRFNRSFSLSVRLGYNYRGVDFAWDATALLPNGELFQGVNPDDKKNASASFHDLNIPVFFSYTLPINRNIAWTSSFGLGVAINLYSGKDNEAKIYDPMIMDEEYLSLQQGLYLCEWEIKPYATIQTGLEFSMGFQRLRATIGYKLPIINEYYFGYNGAVNGGYHYEFRQDMVEVGLSFFL